MNCLLVIIVVGVSMATSITNAAVGYLAAERRVEAISNENVKNKVTGALGTWDESVSFSSNPGPGIVVTQRPSNLSDSQISFYGVSTGDVFATGSSTLFARVRLIEQTLITFSGAYNRFGIIGNSEITASIIGGDYNYSFAAPEEEIPAGSFGATNVLLQPGDYDINLLVRSINFEAVNMTFELSFTTVPAPGAAGLAMVGLGAAGLRRSRRAD